MYYLLKKGESFKGYFESTSNKKINENEFDYYTENQVDELMKSYLQSRETKFSEISEDRYDEMLCCLPPLHWHNITINDKKVNIFYISEMTTCNLTGCYIRTKINNIDKYFAASKLFYKDDTHIVECITSEILNLNNN